MTLSTEVKEAVIVFHDGSRKYITKAQEESIFRLSMQGEIKQIVIDKEFYTFSSMSKILSLDEFYRQYPDESPAEIKEFIAEPAPNYTIEQIAEMSRENFKGVLAGLKQYIDEEIRSGKNPECALKIYEKKLENYKLKYAI